MIASQLPFEITLHIANYLSTADRIECTHVCQAWAIAFQESLWNTIEISDNKTLKDICNNKTTVYESYRVHGCHVKALFLGLRLLASDENLYALQKHMKNIQYLQIECGSLSSINFGVKADWTLWRALKSLDINMGLLKTPNPKTKLLKILFCLPQLEHLEIAQDHASKTVFFTLQDFETLHDYLPLLEYLGLDMESQLITTQDLKLIKNTNPATRLKNLVFTVNKSGHRWLCYFAIKYPNIDSLSTISFDAEDVLINKAEVTRLLGTVSPVFQKLDKLQTTITQQSSTLHFSIWRKLHMHQVPLRHLHCTIEEAYDKNDMVKSTFEDCVNPYKQFLETLFIQVYENGINSWTITDHFMDYSNLAYLRIYTSNAPILVDIILDQCVSLKRLGVSTSWLSTSESVSTNIVMHGLRMLEIYNSSVCSKALRYLSIRCRRLHYMCLDYTSIVGYVSINTGKLSIDMSYTHLKILVLRHVRFTTSKDAREKNGRNINLMVLSCRDQETQVVTYNKRLRMSFSNKFPFVSTKMIPCKKTQLTNTEQSTWFYTTYVLNSYYSWESAVSELNEKETERAKEYYKRYPSEIKFLQETTIGANGNLEGTREKWKKDRFRGYATIKCDCIDEYSINTNVRRDSSDWDDLYDELD